MTNSNQTPPSSAQSVEGLTRRGPEYADRLAEHCKLMWGAPMKRGDGVCQAVPIGLLTDSISCLRTQAAQLLEKDAEIERLRHDLAGHMQNEGDCYADAVALTARVAQLEAALTQAHAVLAMMTSPEAIKQTTVIYTYAQAVEAEAAARAALEPK